MSDTPEDPEEWEVAFGWTVKTKPGEGYWEAIQRAKENLKPEGERAYTDFMSVKRIKYPIEL